jgi:ATP-dependent protease HslVU (ClpYQ) peptidase subunit
VQDDAIKVVVNGDVVFAFAGDASFHESLMHWYLNKRNVDDYPAGKDQHIGADMLAVSRFNGAQYFSTGSSGRYVEVSAPFAFGSGSHFAMAAMMAGASAEKAVEIASRLDPHSGGKITAFSVTKTLVQAAE